MFLALTITVHGSVSDTAMCMRGTAECHCSHLTPIKLVPMRGTGNQQCGCRNDIGLPYDTPCRLSFGLCGVVVFAGDV